MIELKPCPFCGGKAEIKQDIRYPRSGKYEDKAVKAYEVICQRCDCIIYNADNKYFLTEKEATQAWNSRASGWISVDDRLPEDEERILIFVSLAGHESVQLDTCYEDGGYMHLDSGYAFGAEVTHWMPLPEPPEREANEE